MDNRKPIKNLKDGCLFTLKYFGLFSYPLTLTEIHHFNPYKANLKEVEQALAQLTAIELIFQSGDFFMSEDNMSWINERIAGYKRAEKLLKRSLRYGSIIASFPFVRSIALSGSLSKFYASEDDDIDYFIITETNRLWIARTLLHIFKKLTFITGHQHYFCMNYFVDQESLEIQHQNEYSAIETVTLIPLYNAHLVNSMMSKNKWIKNFLPNHPVQLNEKYLVEKKSQNLKKTIELMINGLAPNRLNIFFMQLTDRKWRKKWKRKGFDMNQYDKAFLTTEHISKNHPQDYENKVLSDLEKEKTKTTGK